MATVLHRQHRLSASAAVALLLLASAVGDCMEGEEAAATRRRLGAGSSPPTCRGRCDRCSPCRPVRVAIHPGRIAPMDYYPEAWRCKCGGKLFMP